MLPLLRTRIPREVDVFRYSVISASKPHVALVWDSVWAAGSAVLLCLTWLWPTAFDEVMMVAAWAALATVSAVGLARNYGVRPQFRAFVSWWNTSYVSRIRYGIEAGLEQVNVIIILSIATAVIGASAAASLRGASTILSPFAVLLSALPLVIIPESVRQGLSLKNVWRKLCRIGAAASVAILAVGSLPVLLPARVGELALGDSWTLARAVLPVIAVEYFGAAWMFVASSFLRFQGKSTELLGARIAYGFTSIVLCSTIAFVNRSAFGVAVGLATSALLMAAAITYYVHPRPAHRLNRFSWVRR